MKQRTKKEILLKGRRVIPGRRESYVFSTAMSTERRQSGRLAKLATSPVKSPVASKGYVVAQPKKSGATQARTNKQKAASNSEEEFDDSDEESVAESDDSEYGKRPSKRQKITKSSRGRKSASTKTCYLTAMPLDVLLEIFAQLTPKDLLSLARTNSAFRATLHGKQAISIWKRSRDTVDAPSCPPDLTEQQWARLLFGGTKCQNCGAKGIQRVDFGLRRRACTKCLKANLVVTSSFTKRYPHLKDTTLDLLPYTNIGGHAHGHASNSNFYWKSDIEEMATKLAGFERDIHMRAIDARKKLEVFTAERTRIVGTIKAHAKICVAWAEESYERGRKEEAEKVNRRYQALKAKFLELGYLEGDITAIKYSSGALATAELTDRIWKRLLPELEPVIRETMDRRLAKERNERIENRTRAAEQVYAKYKKTLTPAQWCYLPGTYEVLQLPAFSAAINAPSDGAVNFQEAMDCLPDFVLSWATSRKAILAKLVDDAVASGSAPFISTDHCGIDLATAVFSCLRDCERRAQPQNSTLIGWDAAANHRCRDRDNGLYYHYNSAYGPGGQRSVETVLKFSKDGSAAAAALVSLTPLDAKAATSAEMDDLDPRFLCILCKPRNTGWHNKQAQDAYSWRAAVSHFVYTHSSESSSSGPPNFLLLNNADTQEVKAAEGQDPTLSWSCNHCTSHLDDYKTRSNVVEHVRTVHGIAVPKAPGDLFRYLDTPRAPASFHSLRPVPPKHKATVPLGSRYNCKQCFGQAGNRIFGLSAVQNHLKDKHKVLNPVAGVDWKQL
ncbi:hypothetical protein C8J57DRAFT_99191 [Mycena rebaudengoi]|nr:hypothetical protein C8J57DRAFT_99191 [Mycena rebaudengoi]